MKKRRSFTAEFKAKVAKVALRNDKTAAEIATHFEIHPMLVTKWKRQASEHLQSLFEDKRMVKSHIDPEKEKQRLYEEIGKLKMQLDWVKKKCGLDSI